MLTELFSCVFREIRLCFFFSLDFSRSLVLIRFSFVHGTFRSSYSLQQSFVCTFNLIEPLKDQWQMLYTIYYFYANFFVVCID